MARHDIRSGTPDGPFDLVLCRNLVFTYFDPAIQRAIAAGIADAMRPPAALVLGAHEQLSSDLGRLEPWDIRHRVYRKLPTCAET